MEQQYLIKVGKEYVYNIGFESGLSTNSRYKHSFKSKEEAEVWAKVVKELTFGQEQVRILTTEEDKKETTFVGITLNELLEKGMPQTIEKAKDLFNNRYVTSLEKRYSMNGVIYKALVKSQTRREYYNVSIELDKSKKVVAYKCECPAHTEQNPLCKHILAVILAILDC